PITSEVVERAGGSQKHPSENDRRTDEPKAPLCEARHAVPPFLVTHIHARHDKANEFEADSVGHVARRPQLSEPLDTAAPRPTRGLRRVDSFFRPTTPSSPRSGRIEGSSAASLVYRDPELIPGAT